MRGRIGFLRTLVLGILIAAAAFSSPALADKRIALVVGNSAYGNVAKLLNPANDANLMADTLRSLGFTLVGGNAQLDLDKASFDRAVQNFGRQLVGADVALFYFAGHGLQVRGANYLVPVDANPVREADVDFQMLDSNLLLRQMEGSGTKLNIVILDACRNNPFGGRGLRSADSGLAQMRAPEGTLISFATQPGNVALDGTDGNSPYTKALAQTIRRSGLGIFDAFNEVGLAVKRATGGSQLPWVSNSPIDGRFFFAAPTDAVPPGAAAAASEAAQLWGSIQNTTSLAMLDAFIQQHGGSIYGSLARARMDELRRSQIVAVTPVQPAAPPAAPRATKSEVVKEFSLFGTIFNKVRDYYVERPDDKVTLSGAIDGMRQTFPSSQRVSSAAGSLTRDAATDLNAVHETALEILNDNRSGADDKTLLPAAINGMLSSLDPHSNYLDAGAFRDLQTQARGSFGGLGLEVTMEGGLLKVVAPLENMPAARAGVLGGDFIERIDDKPVLGLTLNQAVEKLRGQVNTQVKLIIQRPGRAQPIEVSVTRDIVRVVAVRSRIEGGDVAYIRISQFNEQAVDGLKNAITQAGTEIPTGKLKGYILDLRNNPGGLLDQTVSIADQLLEKGEIVSTRGRKAEETQRFNAKAGDLTKGKPIIVLINGGSAAASEILAGALQDHKRATIMGTRSFGKGSLQTIIPLGAGEGALRLTTARYFTPSGRSIQAQGIVPDVEVLQDVPEELKNIPAAGETLLRGHLPGKADGPSGSQAYVPSDPKNDKALHAAFDRLRNARR